MSQTLPRVDQDAAPAVDGVVTEESSIGADEYVATVDISKEMPDAPPAMIELVVPVYNEASTLEVNMRRLRTYLDESFPFSATIRIVDNASTDATWDIACRLTAAMDGISGTHLNEKGKGRAIRAAWTSSPSQIVAYMDADLSTDLGALLPLVAPLISGHSDVSIGSRFAPGAHVLRGARREVVSRCYNLLLRAALRNQFSDATCGFKAMRRETAQMLLPAVSDDHWFFDTELLILAERNGFRIHEVPVDWIDDADSRVNIHSVAREDLRGVLRLMRNRAIGRPATTQIEAGRHLSAGQGRRYAGVGVLSTAAYLAVFIMLRQPVGTYWANLAALALSTAGNTFAHARFTFGPKSGLRMGQAVWAGWVAFLTGVTLTSLAFGFESLIGTASAASEVLAILIGIVASSFIRLVLLRSTSYQSHSERTRS